MIPDRHLGLLQAGEVEDLEARLDHAAACLRCDDWLDRLRPTSFQAPALPSASIAPLAGVRIAIARDAAFSFIYQANLDLLRALGARLDFFSPLNAEVPPPADAIYLPGGYPQLHAARLSVHAALRDALHTHVSAGKPLLAECGGMMLLMEGLVDVDGCEHAMAGLLPGRTRMQRALQALSLQSVPFDAGELRGHSYHHSQLQTPLTPQRWGTTQSGQRGESVFRCGSITASYIHFYGPSNPAAFAGLFRPDVAPAGARIA